MMKYIKKQTIITKTWLHYCLQKHTICALFYVREAVREDILLYLQGVIPTK
jgi:hypothetical protein